MNRQPSQNPQQRTDHGRTVLQCTSLGNLSTAMFNSTVLGPPNSNYARAEGAEARQSDSAIQRMLLDDHGLEDDMSNHDQASTSAGTRTSSGIFVPTNTSTTNSIDDVGAYLRKLALRSPSITASSGDEEEVSFKQKVPEMSLRELSSKLGSEWEKLATFLNFDHVQIQRFKINNPNNVEEQIFIMLTTWRCTLSTRATPHKLARALSKSGRQDLADEIMNVQATILENRPSAKHVPNQMFNNLLASLTELTEQDRQKIAILIRKDILTGDGAELTGPDGKAPDLMKIIECLEVNNYLDANNVWYLQYLLLELEKKDLYQKVLKYGVRRFKKNEALFLSEPSSVRGKNNCEVRFKVMGKPQHFGGMNLEEFKTMLAAKFDGEVRYINNIGALKGCIELIFQMPVTYKEKLVDAATERAQWLLDLHVLSIEVKEEDVMIVLQTETDEDQTAELSKEMLLLLAIINHDRQEVEQLLTDGACPNFKPGGKWLLQWAIFMDQEEDKEEFVQLLLEYGADRDAKDEMNMSAVEESMFLGRCRQTLTFTPKKPAHSYLKKEEGDSIQFIPKLTADNLEVYSVFSLEKRQFVCLPCKKIWAETVWGYRPFSSCKLCQTQYHPMSKGKECPRRLVKCENCNIVFTTFRHPYIPKHCRQCHKEVVDFKPPRRRRADRGANGRSHSPLPPKESVSSRVLYYVKSIRKTVWDV